MTNLTNSKWTLKTPFNKDEEQFIANLNFTSNNEQFKCILYTPESGLQYVTDDEELITVYAEVADELVEEYATIEITGGNDVENKEVIGSLEYFYNHLSGGSGNSEGIIVTLKGKTITFNNDITNEFPIGTNIQVNGYCKYGERELTQLSFVVESFGFAIYMLDASGTTGIIYNGGLLDIEEGWSFRNNEEYQQITNPKITKFDYPDLNEDETVVSFMQMNATLENEIPSTEGLTYKTHAELYTAINNAIRRKTGKSEGFDIQEAPKEIDSIEVGEKVEEYDGTVEVK